MFQASISKASILKKVIEAIRELVTDVNIELNNDGISLQAMDASHVALVSFLLKREKFEEYQCEGAQVIGINISNLAKVLKCADNDDRVTLKADPNSQKLTLIFEGRQDEKISQFNLNLLAMDNEQLGIPDHDYPAVINMRSDEFSRVCRELSQLSDTLAISVSKLRVTFSVDGNIGEGHITLKPRDRGERQLVIEAQENVDCSYAMRYLNLFNKAAVLGEEIQLSISQNLPLIVTFEFELGFIKFYLAPKVTDGDS
jgi:proliferating cell nuclear antigen